MTCSTKRSLTPVIQKENRFSYGIAMTSYLLIGLSLAMLVPSSLRGKIETLNQWALPVIGLALFFFSPMAKNFLRVFSQRSAHLLSLGLICFCLLCRQVVIIEILGLFILPLAFILLYQSTHSLTTQLGSGSSMAKRMQIAFIFLPLGLFLGIALLIFTSQSVFFWIIPLVAFLLFVAQIRCPALPWSNGPEGQPKTCPTSDDGNSGLLFWISPVPLIATVILALFAFASRDSQEVILWVLTIISYPLLTLVFDFCFDHGRAIFKNIIKTKKSWLLLPSLGIIGIQAYAFFAILGNQKLPYGELALLALALMVGSLVHSHSNRYLKGIPSLTIGLIACLLATGIPTDELTTIAGMSITLPYLLLLIGCIPLTGSSTRLFARATAEQDIHTRSTIQAYYNMLLGFILLCYSSAL